MGYRMYIPNSEAPEVSRVLEIAALNLFFTKFVSLPCSIDNLKLAVIP
jgi:hypothetical protein